MRIAALIHLLLAFLGTSSAQEKPVPVDQETHHKVVLKNDWVEVMHVTLPAGERTLYHTHGNDRAAVELNVSSITQQKVGEAEGAPVANHPGDLSMLPQVEGGYSHRVHNLGPGIFDVLDIEFLQRPQKSSDAMAPVAAENPSARAYRWTLNPGARTPEHSHHRPYLIIAATPMQLKMTGQDGQSSTDEVKPGDFHWVETPVTHVLANDGRAAGQIIELELK
ncbi:MAG: hypothetical protein DMG81_20360 [Acidobacteria bacterium]|nr:MAG: hypothetical protein DMG81_20360 [Acidobacteriota bacterium]